MAENPNSGISDRDIKRTAGGYVPTARVFVQDLGDDGRLAPTVTELRGWESLNSSISVQGQGACHITFNNSRDRMWRRSFIRNYQSPDIPDPFGPGLELALSEVSRLGISQADGTRLLGRFRERENLGFVASDTKQRIDYMRSQFYKNLDNVNFVNPARRYETELKNQRLAGVKVHVTDLIRSTAGSYSESMFEPPISSAKNSTGEAHVIIGGRAPIENTTQTLMQRVFVDLLGRDGRWYAGFTGILSTIVDVMVPGSSPTTTWVVKDYWRLFQLTEMVAKQSANFNQLEENITLQTQSQLGVTNYYSPNVFSGMNGVDVINSLVDVMQGTFCQKEFARQRAVKNDSVFASELATSPDAFFIKEPFFNKPQNLRATYEGLTPLRRVNSVKFDVDVTLANGLELPAGFEVPGRLPGEGIREGDFVEQLLGDILIDKAITEGPQGIVYQETIERVLQPFQAQRVRGDAILKKVAESTYYDMFFNGNGDLVYQIPRYNNAPGEYDPIRFQRTIGDKFKGQSEINKNIFGYDFSRTGDYDFSPSGDSLPIKGHGFNYTVTDLSLEQWNLISTEEPIVTNVRAPTGVNFINLGQVITDGYMTGITRVGDVADLQRRFGLRTVELPQLIIPEMMTNKTNEGRRGFQDVYALAAMVQMNGQAQTGTVGLTFRPDLEPGKNVFLFERQKLYYILGITHAVQFGQDGNTLLHLGYGHDFGDRITNPWVEARPLLQGNVANPDQGSANIISPKIDEGRKVVERQAGTVPVQPELRNLATAAVSIEDERELVRPRNFTELQRTFGIVRGANNPSAAVKDYIDLPSPPADRAGRVSFTNGHEANMVAIPYKFGNNSGVVLVHKKLARKFTAIFSEISHKVLTDWGPRGLEVKLYGARAGYNPRHTLLDIKRPLSTHCWGIALDLQVQKQGSGFILYHMPHPLPLNELLNPIFEKHNFFWGRWFSQRDDIHWQFADRGVTAKPGPGLANEND